MDVDRLKNAYRAKYAEAKKLADEWRGKEEEIPLEVSQQIDAMLGQCDELQLKIQTAEGMQTREALLEEPAGTKAAHLGWRDAGPAEGDAPVDLKAWREIEIKSFNVDPQFGVIVPTTRKFRFHTPLNVSGKDYPIAFEAYLRKGFGEMGPTDRKTLSGGVDSAGGFTIPEDYHVELIKKIATLATVRANCRVVQTSRDMAQWPKIHYTTDDKYTSGVRLTWTGEVPASASSHRVTDPTFGLYTIPVHTAMASMPITNNLLEDSAFDIVGVSSDLLAEAFALGENDAAWNGNGIARPHGILAEVDDTDLNGPRSVVSGTASTLTADGVIDLVYALPAQYEANAKLYMAKGTEKVVRKLKDKDDNYLWPVWPQVGGFGVAPREVLGFPAIRDEFIPAVAAGSYPIVFGDLTGYIMLDRVGIAIQRLSELYAETNITLLLARKRVGGQVVQPWRIKVQKVAAS